MHTWRSCQCAVGNQAGGLDRQIKLVQALSPDSLFSNVFLHLSFPSGIHADSHNHTSIDNTLIPLGVWGGGELWCEDPGGSYLLNPEGPAGTLHSISMPCLRFNSRMRHAVLPWNGDRFVLGAYHIRDEWRLSSENAAFLSEQGFKLLSQDHATRDPYE